VTDTERKPWSELSPVTQAALRCKDPVFWAYLWEEDFATRKIEDEETAAAVVRDFCEVTSRSELAEPSEAQATWYDIDNLFQAWKARER
jgi:hypothetical protein